ncbi:hypothetical protein H072_7302 [Dactylellina haptotyla CBS 200.50]|uniref:Uncharacterized protein n=1 Tax=Dactylellina haptotyla (strain CBS 200.50) TaxID=1284197 RepID=S8BUF4_DACHA|nr:hypothetical protein H072_7302 [Dactylellina haptotyla CBS 200.50]
MAIEDTWYDYYRGPTSGPTFSEKLTARVPSISINPPPGPLSPTPSTAFDPQARSDYAPTLVSNVWRESERRAEIRAKHARERQMVALILELLCQIAGFTCAIVFGVWAVKSYNVAVVGLKVQTVANQLSLRMMCKDDASIASDPMCVSILSKSVTDLWDASAVQNPLEGTEISMPKLSLGKIVGITIGSVAGFLLFNIIWAVWRRRNMIMQLNSHIGTDLCPEAGSYGTASYTFSQTGSKTKNQACQSSASDSVSSTPYSGNPLTPNGTEVPKNKWRQQDHMLHVY